MVSNHNFDSGLCHKTEEDFVPNHRFLENVIANMSTLRTYVVL